MTESKIRILKASQFATRFALRPQQFAWLLGAGASASAGIPTGFMMIRDFKTRLFCQELLRSFERGAELVRDGAEPAGDLHLADADLGADPGL